MLVRAPKGRAGRVWLQDRVAVARRACDLLQHKQKLLQREHRRLTELVARTGAEWTRAASTAQLLSCRALVGGDSDELRRAVGRAVPADVSIEWVNGAGVRYPGMTTVRAGPVPACAGPVLLEAGRACSDALELAVRHAAAATAVDRVERELAVTVRRLRAVRDRWLPELEDALRALDLALEEVEREETTRLRRAGPGHGAAGEGDV